MYMANRRRHGRRRYRRNPGIVDMLKDLFKVGAIATIGFAGHRVLSWVVSEKLLSNISFFQTGSGAEYRGLVGGLAAGLGGLALAAKLGGERGRAIGAGVATSFVHNLLLFALKKAGQPGAAGVLAAYPDAEGRAFHSMHGYGSYYSEPGASGLGEYDYYNQYSGLSHGTSGADSSMGEFYLPGVQGIGEYEATSAYQGLGAPNVTDEGIHPNLDAAEHALSVAEAAAGIGDMPLTSIQNAYQVAAPVQDGPAGSRAGILQGSEGIFGGMF